MDPREEKATCAECGAEWWTLTRFFDVESEDQMGHRSHAVTHVTAGAPCDCAAKARAAAEAAKDAAEAKAEAQADAEFLRLAALPDADPQCGIEDEDCGFVEHMLDEMRSRAKIDAMMSGVEGQIRAVRDGDWIKFLSVDRRTVICARVIAGIEE